MDTVKLDTYGLDTYLHVLGYPSTLNPMSRFTQAGQLQAMPRIFNIDF